MAKENGNNNGRMKRKKYEKELRKLQEELCKVQEWVKYKGLRVIVVFEGRDAAGKGGTIRAISERVSPRVFRVVALPAPSDREKTQLYMQRYIQHFPASGEIVIFDRSWYNRAGVEHVMGFCTAEQHQRFLDLCPIFENYIVDGKIILIKYWMEVGKKEQKRRFMARINDPLRQWKLSPMDLESFRRWNEFSRARDEMFKATDSKHAPWFIVRSDDKKKARLNCISHLLSMIPYGKRPQEKAKLPRRKNKDSYDDQKSLRRRVFVQRNTDRHARCERESKLEIPAYMSHHLRRLSTWGIPALYAGAAILAGFTFPRVESDIFPGLVSTLSVSTATAIYSAIASGMIALTGIVFSLTFVMVQFSATAYSPRIVVLIARDPLISHALGIFTATFLYAIAALAGVDRNGSGKVPFVSTWLEIGLLLVSVAMFISLIHRISLLQVTHMLIFTGDQGRKVIMTMYPSAKSPVTPMVSEALQALPRTQTLIHHGKPRSLQAVDIAALVKVAEASGGVIEMAVAIGDTLVERTPLLHVLGVRQPIAERELWDRIEIGDGRTFKQDPKYAIRLLVDIAIKALSPAINDPTTAVQGLDQIEDLLLRLGDRHLEIGAFCDNDGVLRLLVPFPSWDDLLRLAFDEISFYGANSVQVMRRMNAMISDLIVAVPDERRPALKYWSTRLKASINRSFADGEERTEASQEDRQGLGIPRQRSSETL